MERSKKQRKTRPVEILGGGPKVHRVVNTYIPAQMLDRFCSAGKQGSSPGGQDPGGPPDVEGRACASRGSCRSCIVWKGVASLKVASSSGSRRSSRSRKSNQLGLAVRRIWSSTSTQPRTPVGFCDPFRCVLVHFAVGHRRATKTTVVYDFVVVVAVIGARRVLGQRNQLARRRIRLRARRGALVRWCAGALHELRAKRRQIGRGVCRLHSWKAAGEWLKAHHRRRPSIRSAALCFHRSFRGVEENVLVRLVHFAVAAPRASFPLQGAHAPCPSECEDAEGSKGHCGHQPESPKSGAEIVRARWRRRWAGLQRQNRRDLWRPNGQQVRGQS